MSQYFGFGDDKMKTIMFLEKSGTNPERFDIIDVLDVDGLEKFLGVGKYNKSFNQYKKSIAIRGLKKLEKKIKKLKETKHLRYCSVCGFDNESYDYAIQDVLKTIEEMIR